jgi:beta-lactamase class D
MRSLLLLYLIFLLPVPASAEDSDLAELFAKMSVAGTIIISSANDGKTYIHDESRASRRYRAASTFKILNTLISLDEKVVSIEDTFKWDGVTRDIPEWNHDQTLESAFKTSCVWCYQQLAKKVGGAKYQNYISSAGYGELHEPFNETTFWLDGSLTISAIEQVEFLKKVHRRQLPFAPSSYDTLAKIMLIEQNPEYSLRAKTGWAASATPSIGWYVGYIESSNGVWFFAMNMDVMDNESLSLRQKVVRESFRLKKIIK